MLPWKPDAERGLVGTINTVMQVFSSSSLKSCLLQHNQPTKQFLLKQFLGENHLIKTAYTAAACKTTVDVNNRALGSGGALSSGHGVAKILHHLKMVLRILV